MLKVLFDEKQAPQRCPTQHFLMSWADLFSAPPKAKDHKGLESSASPHPRGAHSPPFHSTQRRGARSDSSEAANPSRFPGVRVSPAALLWHIQSPGAAAELPSGSRDVGGVCVCLRLPSCPE